MSQTGQSGFCLLMALWQKANELKWINQFTMTNTELLYKAGFNSEKTLIQVRNRLCQLGYFEYIKPRHRRQCGTYILEYDLIKLANYLPEVSKEVSSEVSIQVNSEVNREVNSAVSSEVNINKLNITKQNITSSSASNDHLELDQDDEADETSEIVKVFTQTFAYTPNQIQLEMLMGFLKDGLTHWHILEALKRAAEAGAKSPAYSRVILQDWLSKKAYTQEDVERLDSIKARGSKVKRLVTRDDYVYTKPDPSHARFFSFMQDNEQPEERGEPADEG